MTRSLPTAPNMEHLKKQAKDLRKSHRNGNAACCEELKLLHQFSDCSAAEILASKLSLNEAQMALALSYGFKSWGDLKKYVLGKVDGRKYLHIHTGDSSAQPMRDSSVQGDVLVWREVYVEGPVPGNLSDGEFKQIRAEYISRSMGVPHENILQGMNAMYDTLASAHKYEEVVIWSDPCMFCQTIVMHLVKVAVSQQWTNTKLSLVCFELDFDWSQSQAIETLMNNRIKVGPEAAALALQSWSVFTSDNPKSLQEIIAGACSALPNIKKALMRHLQQFPSVRNGLNRTQEQILRAVQSSATKLGPIFGAVQQMEELPFMGDTSCWNLIRELASGRVPMLHVDGPDLSLLTTFDPETYEPPSAKELKQWDISITDAGKAVLDGTNDYTILNGIDRWVGGVHLSNNTPQWRWNENTQQLIELP